MNVRAEYGKRARQKATHHEAILDAAERILGHRHPAEVAVDEIAAEAGVAKGTVYNYFADKVSLVEANTVEQVGEPAAEHPRRIVFQASCYGPRDSEARGAFAGAVMRPAPPLAVG